MNRDAHRSWEQLLTFNPALVSPQMGRRLLVRTEMANNGHGVKTSYHIAVWFKDPKDGRRRVFGPWSEYQVHGELKISYKNVTHWAYLED